MTVAHASQPATSGGERAPMWRRIRWMGLSWLVFAGLSLLEVLPAVFADRSGEGLAVPESAINRYLISHIGVWHAWWLSTPLIFRLADRFPPTRERWAQFVLIHVVAAIAVINAGLLAVNIVLATMDLNSVSFRSLSIVGFIQYGGILGVALLISMQRRERDHAVTAARLAAELAEARAEAVTAHLRPHFLYNALNGIAMLIRSGANASALEAVLGYSELLREAVEGGAADVSLRDEIALIDRYVAIERMRFPDSFSATMSVSPDVADAVVPGFLLQPIVENALRHGLSGIDGQAHLEILALRRDGAVRVEVRDNGTGLPPDWRLEHGSGVGLRTTRARLQQRFGSSHHFELHSPVEGGTVVILEFPYTRAPGTHVDASHG